MRDPHFERTVVLLCSYGSEGALGLVINRDGPVPLAEVLRGLELPGEDYEETPTWWGGPVGRSTGFVVWRGQADPEEGWTVGREVAVSPSVERLTHLVESKEPFSLCLGYAGWSAAQLDEEIARGSWLVADVDARIVFDAPLEDRYTAALALLGLRPETVWMQPIDE